MMIANAKTPQRRAFTLVEILIVLAVLGIIAAIFFPLFGRARASARTSTCAANLRQIGQALSLYISDHDGFYPLYATNKNTDKGLKFSSVWWMNLGLKPPPVCPEVDLDLLKNNSDIRNRMGSYASNLRLTSVSGSKTKPMVVGKAELVLRYPSLTVVAFDSRPLICALIGPDTAITKGELKLTAHPRQWESAILQFPLGATRHQGGANYLFGDGHVKWYRPEQLSVTRVNDGIHPGFGL